MTFQQRLFFSTMWHGKICEGVSKYPTWSFNISTLFINLEEFFDIRGQVLDMGPFPKENYLFGLEFQH